MTKLKSNLFLRWGHLSLLIMLTSCSSMNPNVVIHGFTFDASVDSPNIEILDYQYGDSKNPGARAEPSQNGRISQHGGSGGPMQIAEFLYVKWKIRSSGLVFERKVDLRGKLTREVEGGEVLLVVHDSHLTIYLVTNRPRTNDISPNGPLRYRPFIVKTIYSD